MMKYLTTYTCSSRERRSRDNRGRIVYFPTSSASLFSLARTQLWTLNSVCRLERRQSAHSGLRAGRGPGTRETDGGGDMRSVRYRDRGDGIDGGSSPSTCFVSPHTIDWGGGPDHQEPKRAWAVSRVTGS